MSISLRLVDFNIKNDKENDFKMQMFGINEEGVIYSVIVSGFKPYFYVKVNDNWNKKIYIIF